MHVRRSGWTLMSSPPSGSRMVLLICHTSLSIGYLRSLRGLSFPLPGDICRGLTKAVFVEPVEGQLLLISTTSPKIATSFLCTLHFQIIYARTGRQHSDSMSFDVVPIGIMESTFCSYHLQDRYRWALPAYTGSKLDHGPNLHYIS